MHDRQQADAASGATSSVPTVTVIVPTYNRAATLERTLASLLAQDYPADRFEVVVVDNSSTDQTEAVVRRAEATAPCVLRYYRKPNQGPASARNFGLGRSSGDIVAFTDSDCRAAPSWIRNAVGQMAAGVGLVGGAIHPVWPEGRRLGFFQHQLEPVRREDPLYPTANVLYRREALERVGGFDERFGAYRWGPPMGGEDTDLAWRVRRAGYRTAFAGDAVVEHEASPISPKTWLLEPLKVQVYPRLVARIPELRSRYFWCRYFVNWSSPLFYLALGGIAVALRTRSWRPLVSALPWAWIIRSSVRTDYWPPTRWWRIPLKYALLFERYGLATAMLLVASARHRVLVL